MPKPSRILVITDLPGQRQLAIDRGAQHAVETGADLELVAFAWDDSWEARGVFDTAERNAIRAGIEAKREQWLAARVRDARKAHPGLDAVEVQARVVWGRDIHQWVRDQCEKARTDLVVKSAHRTRSLIHMPTDWHLIRDCPAPVLLAVDPRRKLKTRHLAVIDATREDKAHQALHRRVVRRALDTATASGGEVHLGWCITIPEVLADLDAIDPRKYEARVRAQSRPALDALAEEFEIPGSRVHVVKGKAGRALAGLASKIAAREIVIGSMARKGVSGLVVGNTAEEVLAQTRCDVLTVSR